MSETRYDVIVVGSGGGGLAAAAAAARGGAGTLVLEAMPRLGGYLNPFRVKGFSFDTGLHYVGDLGEGGTFRRLLERLGAWERVSFVELDPDGFKEYHFGDFVFRMPGREETFRSRLLEAFPGEKEAVAKFLAAAKKFAAVARDSEDLEEGFLPQVLFLLRHPSLLKYGNPGYTFGHFLDETTRDPKLRAVLGGMSGEGGLPPERSSVFSLMVLAHFSNGAYYPRGGSGAFRDAFVDSARTSGAEFRTNARVTGIARSGGLFTVKTAKETFEARAVICNADPTLLYGGILEGAPPKEAAKAKGMEPSIGSFCAYVGTDLDLPSLGITGSILSHSDSLDTARDWEDALAGRLPDGFRSFAITCPSVRDPEGGHAPAGKHGVEILAMCPFVPFAQWAGLPSRKRGPEYEALKADLGMKLLRRAERYIPGLTEHMEVVEFSTPLSNLYWVNAPAGGCYGPAQTPSQTGPGRFAVRTEVEGLYLCGAGTMGGGVHPVIASGEKAATAAMKHLQAARH